MGYVLQRAQVRDKLRFLPGWLRDILQFNQLARDRWVQQRAHEIPPGSRVLDVGAGPNRYRSLFSHCRYVAQDFCKYKGPEWEYGKIEVVSDLALPFLDGSFDLVVCTEVLEHIPHPIQALKEFARILRPRSRVLLTAPLGSGIHQAPYHFYGGFTPYWYQKFLAESGFEDIRVEANAGFFKHFGQESARLVALLGAPGTLGLKGWGLRVTQWIAAVPFVLLIPAFCAFLDRFDRDKEYTVGYFVSAVRKSERETNP